MPTVKEILKARNLDDESINTLLTNPAYESLLESFIREAEEGKTARMKAEETEANLKTWHQNEVLPYVQKADQRVAEAEGKLAATTAHLKALKDAGYDIPDSYFSAPEKKDPPAPQQSSTSFDPKTFDDRFDQQGKAYMSLLSMSEKARDLLGHGLDIEAEYDDFGKNRRPTENLRQYVSRKYDLEGKQAAREAAAKQKELDEYAENKVKAYKAEIAQKYGDNPETRLPAASKFDRIRESTNGGQRDSWKTDAGRRAASRERMEKYSGASFLN